MQNEHRKTGNVRLVIPADFPLWNFLVQDIKKSRKASRVQAFFDLIEKQQVALLRGESESIGATMNSLANEWSWNRETVTRFIDSLEQLGALSVDKTANRRTVTLNYSIDGENGTGDFLSPSEPRKPSGASNSP